MLLPDGDEVEAIAPSHLPTLDFFATCCRNAVTPHARRMSLVHHANFRTSLPCVPRWFCQFLLERLAMWPRGHISNRMRSASLGLRLLRQCERRPRALYCHINWISLAVVGGCTLCSWSARASRTVPRADFLR